MRIILLFLVISHSAIAQWSNLNQGLDRFGRVMYYDSSSGNLFVGGNFNYADSLSVHHIAIWDGLKWDSLNHGAYFGSSIYSITGFQNEIYASSQFCDYSVWGENWLFKWNGQYWDSIHQYHVNNAVHVLKVYNNELYLGGDFTKIGSLNFNHIAKYDGSAFTSFPYPGAVDDYVLAIEFYQGYMYIGGELFDTLTSSNDLERFDGNSFQPFGTLHGLASGIDYVEALQVYNNELYIGGQFTTVAGDPANYIMRWDGNQFHDVGGGMNAPVWRMHVFNGELYVSGQFTMAGSLPVSHIAKWNGNNWDSVCPMFSGSGILDFTLVNNDLYITGQFDSINGISMNNITRYHLPSSVTTEIVNGPTIQIQNPVINFIRISTSYDKLIKFEIFDALGAKLISGSLQGSSEIDVRKLIPGIYYISFNTPQGYSVMKFIKV